MADVWSKIFGSPKPAKIDAPVAPPPITAPPPVANLSPFDIERQSVQTPSTFSGGQIGVTSGPMNTTLAPLGALSPAQINIDSGAGSMTAYQNQLAHNLALRASGQGPSIVDQQAAQARQQNQAAIMAQLASARGGANPLTTRTAMQANVQGNAQLDRDTMMAKIQEQQQAQQLLGQVAGQGRANDIQLGTSQAGFNQQANITGYQTAADYAKTQAQMNQDTALAQYKGNLDRAVAQGGLDQRTAEMMYSQANENARLNAQMGQAFTDTRMRYIQMGLDVDKANQLAALQVNQQRMTGQLGQADIAAKANAANKGMLSGFFNAGAGVLGSGLLGGSKKPDDTGTQPDTGLRTNPEAGAKDSSTGPEGNMVQQNAAAAPVQGADVENQSNMPASSNSSVNYTPYDGGSVNSTGERYAKGGQVIPSGLGQRAVMRGNSYSNDKIPAMLSEDEVIIPRSIMQSKDPAKNSAEFIARIIANRGSK